MDYNNRWSMNCWMKTTPSRHTSVRRCNNPFSSRAWAVLISISALNVLLGVFFQLPLRSQSMIHVFSYCLLVYSKHAPLHDSLQTSKAWHRCAHGISTCGFNISGNNIYTCNTHSTIKISNLSGEVKNHVLIVPLRQITNISRKIMVM